MDSYHRLASSAPSVETSCCGLIRRRRQESRDLDTVLERMEKLQRALNLKSMSVWNHQRERERDAMRAKVEGDAEGARSHMRIALRLRQERSALLKKYENLTTLTSKLQSVYENAAMAGAISSANANLETLLANDYETLMDDLRDNLARVDEQDEVLGEDMGINVDDELDALFLQQEDEEAAEMETRLPDLPPVKSLKRGCDERKGRTNYSPHAHADAVLGATQKGGRTAVMEQRDEAGGRRREGE